ncbi:MAG: pyruvate, phosphate dikinase, partial [Anaerolineae bacterium]
MAVSAAKPLPKKRSDDKSPSRWVYLFSELDLVEQVTGTKWDNVKALLGGKGANLAEMTRVGLPVPPGFSVTTQACNSYLENGNTWPEGLWEQVIHALSQLEEKAGKKLGNAENPLLVSVRSGAKFSMPGMMDTVLNLGMNDAVAAGMVKLTNNPRFVYDAYRRLVQMFGSVVMGIPDEPFEDYLTEVKAKKGVPSDVDLNADDWKHVTAKFQEIYKEHVGSEFPQDPIKQLEHAIEAVFGSWNGKRAIDYRNAANIP